MSRVKGYRSSPRVSPWMSSKEKDRKCWSLALLVDHLHAPFVLHLLLLILQAIERGYAQELDGGREVVHRIRKVTKGVHTVRESEDSKRVSILFSSFTVHLVPSFLHPMKQQDLISENKIWVVKWDELGLYTLHLWSLINHSTTGKEPTFDTPLYFRSII